MAAIVLSSCQVGVGGRMVLGRWRRLHSELPLLKLDEISPPVAESIQRFSKGTGIHGAFTW